MGIYSTLMRGKKNPREYESPSDDDIEQFDSSDESIKSLEATRKFLWDFQRDDSSEVALGGPEPRGMQSEEASSSSTTISSDEANVKFKLRTLFSSSTLTAEDNETNQDSNKVLLGKSKKKKKRTKLSHISSVKAEFNKKESGGGKCLLAIKLLLLLLFVPLAIYQVINGMRYLQRRSSRKISISSRLIAEGWASPDSFKNIKSAQSLALNWISHYDLAQLDVGNQYLSQSYSLAVFYFEMEGSTAWLKNDLWLTGNGYCNWYGVKCIHDTNYVNGEILELLLNQNGLKGTIPSELKALRSLVVLNLEMNQLEGTIPPELSNISNMMAISLQKNNLTGSIPMDFMLMNNLMELTLSFNSLSGSIPQPNHSELQVLRLEHNELTGTIPDSIKTLTKLGM